MSNSSDDMEIVELGAQTESHMTNENFKISTFNNNDKTSFKPLSIYSSQLFPKLG